MQEKYQEALGRAMNGQSLGNYATVIQGFIEKGIPAEEIEPRVNVLTYDAWRALGRQVRKGEHGVKVSTFITIENKNPDGEEETKKTYRRPWRTTVFHIRQTDPIN